MAKTLRSIAARQANATEKLEDEVKWFLDYYSTHSDATTRIMASDMNIQMAQNPSAKKELGGFSRLLEPLHGTPERRTQQWQKR